MGETKKAERFRFAGTACCPVLPRMASERDPPRLPRIEPRGGSMLHQTVSALSRQREVRQTRPHIRQEPLSPRLRRGKVLAPSVPHPVARICSPALKLSSQGLTSHRRASPASAFQPSRCGPSCLRRPAMRSPGSRTNGFADVPGSTATRDRRRARDNARRRVAFLRADRAASRTSSVTTWPARTPVNASRHASRRDTHDPGPMGFRFTVHRKGFSPSPFAGFSGALALLIHPGPRSVLAGGSGKAIRDVSTSE